MRRFILYSVLIIFSIFTISHVFGVILSYNNFKINDKIWNELEYKGIIYNQHDYKSLKFGLGDVALNGCGAVAVYNILVLEDKYIPFSEIIKYFDNNNENLYGILGTNPFSIMTFMKNKGYKVNAYLNSNDFKTASINSKYSIMFYINFNGGHYQLLHNYDGEQFELINITVKMSMEQLLEKTNDCFRVLITIN